MNPSNDYTLYNEFKAQQNVADNKLLSDRTDMNRLGLQQQNLGVSTNSTLPQTFTNQSISTIYDDRTHQPVGYEKVVVTDSFNPPMASEFQPRAEDYSKTHIEERESFVQYTGGIHNQDSWKPLDTHFVNEDQKYSTSEGVFVPPVPSSVAQLSHRTEETLFEKANDIREGIYRKADEAKDAAVVAGQEIRQKASSFKEQFIQAFERIGDKIGEKGEKMQDYLSNKAIDVKENLVDAKETVKESAVQAKEDIKDTAEKVEIKTEQAAHTLKENIVHMKDVVVEKVENAAEYIKESLGFAKDKIVEKAHDAKVSAIHAKDVVVEKAYDAAEVVAEKAHDVKVSAIHAKDVVVDGAKTATKVAVGSVLLAGDKVADKAHDAKVDIQQLAIGNPEINMLPPTTIIRDEIVEKKIEITREVPHTFDNTNYGIQSNLSNPSYQNNYSSSSTYTNLPQQPPMNLPTGAQLQDLNKPYNPAAEALKQQTFKKEVFDPATGLTYEQTNTINKQAY